MIIVKCINPGKNANISKDTEYEVMAETAERYSVINDKGVQKNYDKKLFRKNPQQAVPRQVAQAIPVVPKEPKVTKAVSFKIETDLIDGYGGMGNEGQQHKIETKIYINDKLILENKSATMYEQDSEISCGVHQLTGVITIVEVVTAISEELEAIMKEKKIVFGDAFTIEKIEKELLETMLQDILDVSVDRAGILIMSTNVTGDNAEDYEDLFEIFRENADSVVRTKNPNSENIIELWSYNLQD